MNTAIQFAQQHYRVVVSASLLAVTALAWIYLLRLAASMSGMGMDQGMELAMPQTITWGIGEIILTFLMWAVMMVGF